MKSTAAAQIPTLSSILLSLDPIELLPLSLARSAGAEPEHRGRGRDVGHSRANNQSAGLGPARRLLHYISEKQPSDKLPEAVWNKVVFPKDWSSLQGVGQSPSQKEKKNTKTYVCETFPPTARPKSHCLNGAFGRNGQKEESVLVYLRCSSLIRTMRFR